MACDTQKAALARYFASPPVASWLLSPQPVVDVTQRALDRSFVYAIAFGRDAAPDDTVPDHERHKSMDIEDMLIVCNVTRDNFALGVVYGLAQEHIFAKTPLMASAKPLARRFAVDLNCTRCLEFMELVHFDNGMVYCCYRQFLHTLDQSLPVTVRASLHAPAVVQFPNNPVVPSSVNQESSAFSFTSSPASSQPDSMSSSICNRTDHLSNAGVRASDCPEDSPITLTCLDEKQQQRSKHQQQRSKHQHQQRTSCQTPRVASQSQSMDALNDQFSSPRFITPDVLGPVVMRAEAFEAVTCPSCGLDNYGCLCQFEEKSKVSWKCVATRSWSHFTSLFMGKARYGIVRLNLFATVPDVGEIQVMSTEVASLNILMQGHSQYMTLLRRRAVHALGINVILPRMDSSLLSSTVALDFLNLHNQYVATKSSKKRVFPEASNSRDKVCSPQDIVNIVQSQEMNLAIDANDFDLVHCASRSKTDSNRPPWTRSLGTGRENGCYETEADAGVDKFPPSSVVNISKTAYRRNLGQRENQQFKLSDAVARNASSDDNNQDSAELWTAINAILSDPNDFEISLTCTSPNIDDGAVPLEALSSPIYCARAETKVRASSSRVIDTDASLSAAEFPLTVATSSQHVGCNPFPLHDMRQQLPDNQVCTRPVLEEETLSDHCTEHVSKRDCLSSQVNNDSSDASTTAFDACFRMMEQQYEVRLFSDLGPEKTKRTDDQSQNEKMQNPNFDTQNFAFPTYAKDGGIDASNDVLAPHVTDAESRIHMNVIAHARSGEFDGFPLQFGSLAGLTLDRSGEASDGTTTSIDAAEYGSPNKSFSNPQSDMSKTRIAATSRHALMSLFETQPDAKRSRIPSAQSKLSRAICENVEYSDPDRRHECSICAKRFKIRGDLQRHIKVVHKKEKSFACAECGKAFGHSGHLNRHMASHRGERRFRCSQCGSRFFQASHLAAHMEHIHSASNGRLLECILCRLRVSTNDELQSHLHAVHYLQTVQ